MPTDPFNCYTLGLLRKNKAPFSRKKVLLNNAWNKFKWCQNLAQCYVVNCTKMWRLKVTLRCQHLYLQNSKTTAALFIYLITRQCVCRRQKHKQDEEKTEFHWDCVITRGHEGSAGQKVTTERLNIFREVITGIDNCFSLLTESFFISAHRRRPQPDSILPPPSTFFTAIT